MRRRVKPRWGLIALSYNAATQGARSTATLGFGVRRLWRHAEREVGKRRLALEFDAFGVTPSAGSESVGSEIGT